MRGEILGLTCSLILKVHASGSKRAKHFVNKCTFFLCFPATHISQSISFFIMSFGVLNPAKGLLASFPVELFGVLSP